MSNKDISRFLLQRAKHYTGSRFQQGRVFLDSDFNEGAWHEEEDHRLTVRDLVGPQGTPDATGFQIGTTDDGTLSGNFISLVPGATPGGTVFSIPVAFNGAASPSQVLSYFIGPGAMYVGGIRVELEQPEFIAFQRDFLQMAAADAPRDTASNKNFTHFFYLHVWEQCVSAIEDDEFLEKALGGPDTTVRVRRMRRVEFAEAQPNDTCASALTEALNARFSGTIDPASGEFLSQGRLSLSFTQGTSQDTCAPCDPTATGRYLGAENQAIRIMLTSPGTYVWAFDNGAPLYQALLAPDNSGNTVVTLQTLPKDEEHWPLLGRAVQVIPWSAVLENGDLVADEAGLIENGFFTLVTASYQPDTQQFTIDTSSAAAAGKLASLIATWDANHPASTQNDGPLPSTATSPARFYLRFWQQSDPSKSVAELPVGNLTPPNSPLGNTGVVPTFTVPGNAGDYWIAALRPETPTLVVPFDLQNPNGVPPHGPRNFYAPLALVTGRTSSDQKSFVRQTVEDCRHLMAPVTDLGCCTVIVGDGANSVGQFMSIQKAIDSLPSQGGEVCIRPGLYAQNVVVQNKTNVILKGCGAQTIIRTPTVFSGQGLIEVSGGSNVTIQSLTIEPRTSGTIGQEGLFAHDVTGLTIRDVKANAVPGDPVDAPIVHILRVTGLDVESLDIQSSRRTAVFVEDSEPNQEHVADIVPLRLRDIRVIGGIFSSASDRPPAAVTPSDSSSQNSSDPIQPAAIVFSSCHFVVVEDLRVSSFGAVGLYLDHCSPFEVRRAVIDSKPFAATSDGQARSALQLGLASAGVTVRESVFSLNDASVTPDGTSFFSIPSEHATVVFGNLGFNFFRSYFEDNSVTATPSCFGGLQILGNATKVFVSRNTISQGLGHGITLGSVGWSDSKGAFFRLGAGAGQMGTGVLTGDLTAPLSRFNTTLTAQPETAVTDLEIVDNTIENMGTNGISVLTLLGLPQPPPPAPPTVAPVNANAAASASAALVAPPVPPTPLFSLLGACRIERNHIRHNIAAASTSMTFPQGLLPIGGGKEGAAGSGRAGDEYVAIPMLPFGGIVLGGSGGDFFDTITSPADALTLDIRDNVIENNGGVASLLPVCGIYVFAAACATIANNRITRNGPLSQPTTTPQNGLGLAPGLRAGIAVLLAGASITNQPGVAASPGKALSTTDDVTSFLNGDLLTANNTLRNDPNFLAKFIAPSHPSLVVSGNTVEQLEGRALFATGVGAMRITHNFFSSKGNHGTTTSPPGGAEQRAIGAAVYVHNLGQPWEAFNEALVSGGLPNYTNLPPNNTYPHHAMKYALNLLALDSGQNTANGKAFFCGAGGHTLFSNNQVVLDWKLLQTNNTEPFQFAPVAIISLDHVSVQTNQFAYRLDTSFFPNMPSTPLPPPPTGSTQTYGNRPTLTHVFALGMTVDVSSNRISEPLNNCETSILAVAVAHVSVTSNVTTHCVAPYVLLPSNNSDTNFPQPQVIQNLNNLTFLMPIPADTGPNFNSSCGSVIATIGNLTGEDLVPPLFALLLDGRHH